MKLEFNDDSLIIYLNKNLIKINYYDKTILEDYIKNLVLSIKKIYKIKIAGSYQVNIYENKNYGLIIEFLKKDTLDFFPDLIDLKLNVFYDSEILLKINDYFLINKYKNIYYNEDSFYININDLQAKDQLYLSEFGNYIYGNSLIDIKNNIIKI